MSTHKITVTYHSDLFGVFLEMLITVKLLVIVSW